jgi:transposase
LTTIIEVPKIIKRYWDGILNYFDSRIISDILKSINSIAQLIQINAREYRNTQYFINIVYLKIETFDLKLPR